MVGRNVTVTEVGVEGLELLEVANDHVLGVAFRLDDGQVLCDAATGPYAEQAQITGQDIWQRLRSVGNGYVIVRPMNDVQTRLKQFLERSLKSDDEADDRSA